jgi:hypothetical protein
VKTAKIGAPVQKVCAAVRLQAWFRGHLGRQLAVRQRVRLEQRRLEEKFEQDERLKREAAAAAKRAAEDAAREKREREKDAQLRAFRDRRGTIELMCQCLPSQAMPWEEDASKLVKLLKAPNITRDAEVWLGRQTSRRLARKQYLLLARKWHPDKWTTQGELSIGVATDVTKCLVLSFEHLKKNLPADEVRVSCQDADEEAEVYEFASWVGIAFEGMFELYKERRGVTHGK